MLDGNKLTNNVLEAEVTLRCLGNSHFVTQNVFTIFGQNGA